MAAISTTINLPTILAIVALGNDSNVVVAVVELALFIIAQVAVPEGFCLHTPYFSMLQHTGHFIPQWLQELSEGEHIELE